MKKAKFYLCFAIILSIILPTVSVPVLASAEDERIITYTSEKDLNDRGVFYTRTGEPSDEGNDPGLNIQQKTDDGYYAMFSNGVGYLVIAAPEDKVFTHFWADYLAGARHYYRVYLSKDGDTYTDAIGASSAKEDSDLPEVLENQPGYKYKFDINGKAGYRYIKIQMSALNGNGEEENKHWYAAIGNLGYTCVDDSIVDSTPEWPSEPDVTIDYGEINDLLELEAKGVTFEGMSLQQEAPDDETVYNGGKYIKPKNIGENCSVLIALPEGREFTGFWLDYVNWAQGKYKVLASDTKDGPFVELEADGTDGPDATDFTFKFDGETGREKHLGQSKTTYRYTKKEYQQYLNFRYIKLVGEFDGDANSPYYLIGKMGYSWQELKDTPTPESEAIFRDFSISNDKGLSYIPTMPDEIVDSGGVMNKTIQEMVTLERDYVINTGTLGTFDMKKRYPDKADQYPYGVILNGRYGDSLKHYIILKAPDNVEFSTFDIDVANAEHELQNGTGILGSIIGALKGEKLADKYQLTAAETLDELDGGKGTTVKRTSYETFPGDQDASGMSSPATLHYEGIPEGTKYLKFEWIWDGVDPNISFLRAVGRFSFTGKYKATGETTDEATDKTFTYEVKGYEHFGDGAVVVPNRNYNGALPYFIVDAGEGHKFENFKLKTFKNNSLMTDFTISACIGDDYEKGEYYVVPAKVENTPENEMEHTASITQRYTVDSLPKNTRYLKVTYPYYYGGYGTNDAVVDSMSYDKIVYNANVDELGLGECKKEANYDFAPPKAEVSKKTDTGGKVKSYNLNNALSDYNFLTEFSNISIVHDAKKTRTIDGKSVTFGGSWQKTGKEKAYFIVSPPDNSKISEFNLYVETTGDDFALYEGEDILPYNTQSFGNINGRVTKRYTVREECDQIKVVFPDDIDTRYGEECRIIGYDFKWDGNPEEPDYGYKKYSISPGERQQQLKGWGVFPWFHGLALHPLAEEAIYKDLGISIARFELYADYDLQSNGTYKLDTDELDELIDQIKIAKSYGKEYFMSVWSPPASLKTNKSRIGTMKDGTPATFIEGGEELYAEFLVKAMEYVVEKVGPPTALSIQNESGSANATFQSFAYPNGAAYANMYNLVSEAFDKSDNLRNIPLLAAEGAAFVLTNIFFGNEFEYLTKDETFAQNMDAYAYHGYGESNMGDAQPILDAIGDKRDIWMSEYCVQADTAYKRLEKTFRRMCSDTQWARVNYWIWWMGYTSNFYIDSYDQETLMDGDGVTTLRKSSLYNAFKFVWNSIQPGDYVYKVNTDDTIAVNTPERANEASDFTIIGNDGKDERKTFIIVNHSDRKKTYNVSGLRTNIAQLYTFSEEEPDGVRSSGEIKNGKLELEAAANSVTILVSAKKDPIQLEVEAERKLHACRDYTSEDDLAEERITIDNAVVKNNGVAYNKGSYICGKKDGESYSAVYTVADGEEISTFYVDIANAKVNKPYFKVYAAGEDGKYEEISYTRLEDLWAFADARDYTGYRYYYDEIPKGTRYIKTECTDYSDAAQRYIGEMGAWTTVENSWEAVLKVSADRGSDTAEAVLAAYGKDNELLWVDMYTAAKMEDLYNKINISHKNKISKIKLMLFKDMQSISPLCEAKEVEIKEE